MKIKLKGKAKPTKDRDWTAGRQKHWATPNKDQLLAMRDLYDDRTAITAAFAMLGWDRNKLNHLFNGIEHVLNHNGINLGSREKE